MARHSPSPSCGSRRHAGPCAQRSRDTHPRHSSGRCEGDKRRRAEAETYLRGQQETLASTGVTVERALGVGGAAEEIVAYAERNGIDLIALASHGRSGVQRWVHGSVADRVLHATRTPLLVARPDDGCEVRRVVVCLDGSLAAEGALPVAGALASRLGVPLVRVRVVEAMRLGVLDDPGGSLRRSLVAQEREAALRYLEAVPGGAGVPGEADVLVGRPADEIDAYVQKHPGSLLVLTTRAHRGLPLLVLGSVAHRVVPHAVTGVVLLHAPEQSAG